MQTSHLSLEPSSLHPQRASADEPSEDHDLLAQVATGDGQAFETLYARYMPRIRSYLRRRLHDPESLDEVLTDVMMVMWQKATDCPSHVPLLAWLYGIARHKTLKHYTSDPKRQDVSLSEAVCEGAEPEFHLLAEDRQRILERAISKLPPHERQPIELLVYHGCSYKDIATRLDTSVSTVKTRMRRARGRLVAACSSEGQFGSGRG